MTGFKHLAQRTKQRGAALITATIMSVVIVAILANIFYRHGIDVARTIKGLHGEQALLLALSGESWAMSILKEDDNEYDGLDEPWAIGLPILPVEGGSLSGQIVDLQSRININGLGNLNTNAKYNHAVNGVNTVPLNNSHYQLFSRLSQILELPIFPDQFSAVIDWIDADDYPLPGGFEENDYLIKEPPYRAANKPMTSASELTLVEGFSAPLYAAMSPYITALPNQNITINVNTAEPLVLASLHPNLDEAAVENLILERPWNNIDEFRASLEREAGFLSPEDAQAALRYSPPVQQDQQNGNTDSGEDGGTGGGTSSGFELVSVQSNYFLLTVVVQLGTNMMQLESLLFRAGQGSDVLVLERTIRFLPKTAGAAATAGADEEELESTTTDS